MSDSALQDSLTLRILESPDQEMEELFNFEGTLYTDWLTKWESLSHDDRGSYNHPGWIISGIRAAKLSGRERTQLFTFYDKGEFVGALPFRLRLRQTLLGVKCGLAPFPVTELFANLASLALQERYLRAALLTIFKSEPIKGKRPLVVRIDGLRRPDMVAFKGFFRKSALSRREAIIDVSKDYEAITKKQTRNERRIIKKAQKRLNRLPGLTLESACGGPGLMDAFWAYAELEIKGWKSQNSVAIAKNRHQGAFFRTLLRAFSDTDNIVIYSLNTDVGLIASLICYKQDGIMHFLKTTYDERFREVSPGKMLADLAIRDCCALADVDTVNFMTDKYRWHQTWRPERAELYKVVLIPKNWLGLLTYLFISCQYMIASGIRALKKLCKPSSVRHDGAVWGGADNLKNGSTLNLRPKPGEARNPKEIHPSCSLS